MNSFCALLLSYLVFSFMTIAHGAQVNPIPPFDQQSFLKLRTVLKEQSNIPYVDQDFLSYQERILQFKEKKKVKFTQKDVVLDTFIHLESKLFSALFESESEDLNKIKIVLNRKAPDVLYQVVRNININKNVRMAAEISIYGTENTPAIISDLFVDHMAGQSSAYSTLNGEKAFIYEGYRPNTYSSLIISHEGFHSAMRRVTTLNRMNKLKKIIPTPLANTLDYDAYLAQNIESLETLSASNLESLMIDDRFTSDHHGVIMATLHHGIYQVMLNGFVDDFEREIFNTNYPFNYIAKEQSLSQIETHEMMLTLSLYNEDFINKNEILSRLLSYIFNEYYKF